MNFSEPSVPIAPKPTAPPKIHKEAPIWLTIILIFFLLIAAGVAVFFFKNRTISYAITLPSVPPEGKMEFSYGVEPALSNPEFFGKVKQQFLSDKASFIEANLSTMKISVYSHGELALEVPINSKGKERSWWETPAGLYKVNSKEKAHFSGMGHVWMPWSLNFQGNFIFMDAPTIRTERSPQHNTPEDVFALQRMTRKKFTIL